jgi:hypothetical protein
MLHDEFGTDRSMSLALHRRREIDPAPTWEELQGSIVDLAAMHSGKGPDRFWQSTPPSGY